MPSPDRFFLKRKVWRKRVLIALIYEDRLTGRELAFSLPGVTC